MAGHAETPQLPLIPPAPPPSRVARSATLPLAIPAERRERAVASYEAFHGGQALSPSSYLTPRELEVLAFLTAGKTNRMIATELYLSESSVKAHLTSIYRKLGVSNRTEAALVGLRILALPRASSS